MKDLTITFQTENGTYSTSKFYQDIDFSDEQISFLKGLVQETVLALQISSEMKEGTISLDKFEFPD
jgi:hypothetical protein